MIGGNAWKGAIDWLAVQPCGKSLWSSLPDSQVALSHKRKELKRGAHDRYRVRARIYSEMLGEESERHGSI